MTMAAPMTISVKLDSAAYQAAMARVRSIPGGFRRIVPSALNRAGKSARTLIDKQLRSQLLVKKQASMKRFAMKPASVVDPRVTIKLAPTRIALASFKGISKRKRGLGYSIQPGRRGFLPGGFKTRGFRHAHSGKRIESVTVWRRARRGDKTFAKGVPTRAGDVVRRKPLVVPKGPSLAAVWTKQRGMVREVERRVPQMLVRELYSKLAYITRRRR